MKRPGFHQLMGVLLFIHILIAIGFIVLPTSGQTGIISQVYKRYLLPGPFFTPNRITQSYFLTVSWKRNGLWSAPINPALKTYNEYLMTGNVFKMYRSRLDRAYYQDYIFSLDSSKNSGDLQKREKLIRYNRELYIPMDADSARLTFIRKESSAYTTRVDTLEQLMFNCEK
ncbi:MAG: hypothetical protein MUF39_11930 [Cyclobacteriaceae bacterium]|nr:hypothetical protein [Cyclobacteriaceae bacterium]